MCNLDDENCSPGTYLLNAGPQAAPIGETEVNGAFGGFEVCLVGSESMKSGVRGGRAATFQVHTRCIHTFPHTYRIIDTCPSIHTHTW